MTHEQTAIRNTRHQCVKRDGRAALLGSEQAVHACEKSVCTLHGVRPRVSGSIPRDLATVADATERQRLATRLAGELGFANIAASYAQAP